jgi:signal transduction histidine kinase/CheY-like chemotaxis protein
MERWQSSIRTGEPFEMEFPLRRGADGAFRWFLTRVVPVHDTNGRIVRWFGTNTDIEDLRQARLQAEQSNRLKDEFLATVSHELRTPLNAILGWAQVLQNSQIGEAQRVTALATIERNARSQSQLIDDILDVSRIITGKLRLSVRAVDLENVITAAINAIRPAAEAKNIRLQTLLDPDAGPISGDPDRLQQIIWNLLSNAIKFTPKGGRIQTRLERVNSHVEIVITDTGKGIEPEFLPYVFDRFRQSDGSTTRRHGGLGLGLAIVCELVELHGGTVSVSSKGEGEGATFTVSLPLLPIRREPESDVPRVHPAAEGSGALLNCPPELSDLRVLLASCGAIVTTASSAAVAFKLVQNERFDMLVSDIGMPEEDGFSLIRKIRGLPVEQGGNLPAIALTAYARTEDRIQSLLAGFQMHMPKPVENTELMTAVATLAGRTGNGYQH